MEQQSLGLQICAPSKSHKSSCVYKQAGLYFGNRHLTVWQFGPDSSGSSSAPVPRSLSLLRGCVLCVGFSFAYWDGLICYRFFCVSVTLVTNLTTSLSTSWWGREKFLIISNFCPAGESGRERCSVKWSPGANQVTQRAVGWSCASPDSSWVSGCLFPLLAQTPAWLRC